MAHLSFTDGTIALRGVDDPSILPASCRWDDRTACHRAPAVAYAEIVMAFVRRRLPYTDEARAYAELDGGLRAARTPRPFQAEALAAWKKNRFQGLVILPTGAGKSYMAMMGIDATRRSTLVVAPTLDLVRQWYDNLRLSFGRPVGIIGGGEYSLEDLTVTTYDSAMLHMQNIGDRFGLVVFDECHHLPGDSYRFAASACLAPFRLGLSATPERTDGRHVDLDHLIGPPVYRRDVVDLKGDYLAEYETERIRVVLTEEERAEYDANREEYRAFVTSQGIRFNSPRAWSEFIIRASQSAAGRRAHKAWRRYKAIAFAAPSKLDVVETLLHRHRGDRVLIFTQNNDTAHTVARRFLVPVITHETKLKERSALLAGLADGTYTALATSKVLNEGVDVPDANVAIVISGSGSVREHVQRLGRILRKRGDKRAVLYELVAEDTTEEFTSERRREHNAYQ